MGLSDRLKAIMAENGLKQKELADIAGVTQGYISGLVNDRNTVISQSVGNLIEEKLGYYAEWVINGTGPKVKHLSKNLKLSTDYQKAISLMEQMNEAQVRCVLAFIDYLDEVGKELKQDSEKPQE